MAHAPAGQPVRLKLRMDVQQVNGLKSGTVWGSLKGTTDENIYVEAHRDGWFEAATDNGSGVATMLGIAEYFARVCRRPNAAARSSSSAPRVITTAARTVRCGSRNITRSCSRRRRCLINAEHTAAAQPELLGEAIRLVNSEAGFLWYGGGNQRPRLQQAAINAFAQFGVPIYAEPENGVTGWRGEPALSVRAGGPGVELQHVLPLRFRNTGDGAGARTGGDHARLRENHRRGEQAGFEGPATSTAGSFDARPVRRAAE